MIVGFFGNGERGQGFSHQSPVASEDSEQITVSPPLPLSLAPNTTATY
ncbi:hypothetical protein CKA32_003190 [Geitlerinema sp. FC II]|nr:hypothetical protein CKA32_003190 [Geitlerinema sp. FC II]